MHRVHAQQRLVPVDELFAHHVDRDLDRRARRPLRAAGLEHEELPALDRELEVLHIAVVLLKTLRDPLELRVDLGQLVLHLCDLRRRAGAGDDILTLRVHEILAVELSGAGVGITRERDAGARVVAHVAEDHRLNVHGGAEVVSDLERVAVVDRAAAEPRAEDRLDGKA